MSSDYDFNDIEQLALLKLSKGEYVIVDKNNESILVIENDRKYEKIVKKLLKKGAKIFESPKQD